MDTSEYMSIFLDDTKENLQNLNESLLVLEKEPDNEEKLNEIFRVAHSIKGASATMEFSNMAELTHKMEDVLSKFRNKELNVTSNVLTVLFKCLDTLEKMVDNIEEENDDNIPIEDIINELLEISGKEKPVKKVQPKQNTNIEFKLNEYDINVINQAIEAKMNVFRVNINLEEDTLLKSARAFIIINNLDENGDIIKSSPSTEDIESENFEFTINLVYITEINKEEVMKIITSISDIKSVNIEKIENPKIDREKKSPVNDKIKTKSENKTKKKTDKRAHQSVRVELDRLDKFMNMVSELVINKTRLELIGNKYNIKELSEILEQISMTTTDLQEQVLKIRMLPLEQVFNKFPRMIRDLSVSLGREMELIIEGQDTELDRTVIDEIGEPLIHLIRNSADHGIESREDRIAKGKDPKGIIRLTAYQEGNSAIIKVADDGNGLNVDKIK
ncbi:MAG: Hpt domain-containing protein, partial [Clostridiaceae bacterium]